MPNPLEGLSDVELWNAQLMVQFSCLRSHTSLRHQRQQWFCALGRVLKIEADLRGVQSPQPPYGVGQLKRNAL